MSLDSYINLKKSIINWCHRSDMDLLIDDFIHLAEIDMFKSYQAHEALEIRGQETTSTASVSTKQFELPEGYHALRSIELDIANGSGDLSYKSPNSLVRRSGTGRPKYFTVGSQFEFDITPDQAYTVEINYFKKPTGLSSTNVSNIVLINHPDIYLYGSLYFLFSHTHDIDQANKYLSLYVSAIDGANQADDEGRYGPAPYARIDGPTP